MSDVSIIKEEWLAERKYFGKNTHIYVGALRAFKLGAYRGIGIKTINDLATHLFANGDMLKHNKSADSAIAQIKENRYHGALTGYSDKILLVGINYDAERKEKKHHTCVIEEWNTN